MDVTVLMKIAGIGILVSVVCQVMDAAVKLREENDLTI